MNMSKNQEVIVFNVREQIEKYKDSVEKAVDHVKELEIKTKQDAEKALDIACEAINLAESIEQTKKEITEPARVFSSEINKLSKEFTQKLGDVKETVIEKIDQWKLLNSEVRILETQQISSFDKVELIYEIEDLSKVDRKYLTIDEDYVKLAMKQGLRVIPGLKIVEKKTTSLRRR